MKPPSNPKKPINRLILMVIFIYPIFKPFFLAQRSTLPTLTLNQHKNPKKKTKITLKRRIYNQKTNIKKFYIQKYTIFLSISILYLASVQKIPFHDLICKNADCSYLNN